MSKMGKYVLCRLEEIHPMNLLLILRSEILSLIMVLVLFYMAHTQKFKNESRSLRRMILFSIGHVVFDVITVLTVNRMDIVPIWINDICHKVFYAFSLLTAFELCRHTSVMCHMPGWEYRIRRQGFIPAALAIVSLIFLPVDYAQGRGTFYSVGPALAVTYPVSMLYLAACCVMIILSRRKMRRQSSDPQDRLLGGLIITFALELVQVFVPEMLFTGAICALMVLICFLVSLENPVEQLRNKLHKDALTGLGSRHSYEAMLEGMEKRLEKDPSTSFGVVFCDLNNLKFVNDVHGHTAGDQYISTVAAMLVECFSTADQIYRVGGDEFVAAYTNKDEKRIQWEISYLQQICEEKSKEYNFDISIATGFAMNGKNCPRVRDVIEIADFRMCTNKAEQKRKKYHDEDKKTEGINVTGLTDRVFDAFAVSGARSYPFLHNMETGVTRISKKQVKHFGLPGEYILNFDHVWIEKIHPDDRQRYLESINEIHAGKTKTHEIEYRARDLSGRYVICSCKAAVLSGKDGDPSLFAGSIINHSLYESRDTLTGLPNKISYTHRVNEMIDKHQAAAVMKISLTTFSRINLLYGYELGNEVLVLFAHETRRIVGNKGEVYRLDGTKFALILPDASEEEVNEIYKKIQFAAQHKIVASFMHISLRVAGGVFMKPADYIGTESTIRSNMMFAYEHSKYDYYGNLKYYTQNNRSDSEYALLSAIHRDANDKMEGFYMRYQPIVDSNTEMIVGAEALMRWHSVEYGEVAPGRFIEWLENDPCYFDLANSIMRKVLTDAAEMRKYNPNFSININITIQQLQHEDFHAKLEEILKETDYPPELINLELTERCRVLDEKYLKQEIEYFHSLGIKAAMDDVGTGSSAFALILRLPIDEVKLDRTFVKEIQSKSSNQAFVQSVIDISREKGYRICFEGIEDSSNRDYLKRYSDTLFQGYFYAKPLLIQELRELMKKQKRLKASPFEN